MPNEKGRGVDSKEGSKKLLFDFGEKGSQKCETVGAYTESTVLFQFLSGKARKLFQFPLEYSDEILKSYISF